MTFGCYNKLNMLGMGNMFGTGNMFGGTNVVGQLFSGTNSIFSGFNFFGNNFNYGSGGCGLFMDCKGNYNYDAMAGFAVGGALLNVAGAAIGSVIENKKENSVENLEVNVKSAEKNLETELKELSVKNIEEAKSYQIDSKFQEAVGKATQEFNKVKVVEIPKYENEISRLETKIKALENITDRSIEQEKQLENLRNLKKDKDDSLRKLRESIAEKGDLYQAKANAEKELENEKTRIDNAKTAINKAQEKLKAAQEALREAQLDELDGNKLNRISDKKYNAKFGKNENGEATSEFEGTPEFSKKDLRKALYLYNVATDDKKHIYKQQFLKIYNWLQDNDSKELEGMEQALKLIKKEQ